MCTEIRGCFQRIAQNPFVKLVMRVVPLLLALWMNVDMCLDANQAKTYHEHSFDTNGSYRLWAMKYRNATNDTYLQTVSPAYFYVACVIWILPPFLAGIAMAISHCDQGCQGCCTRFLFLPILILIAVFGCYILIPMMAIVGGIRKLLNENIHEDQKMFRLISYKGLPLLKLFECFGEAIPQLILGVVYVSNNYPYLKEHDDYFGIGVPVSVISCVFSFGSVVIGVFTGCKVGYKKRTVEEKTFWNIFIT